MIPLLAAVFDLTPQSPVLEFWQNSGPFDVYLKLPNLIMFALVFGLFALGLFVPFQRIEPVSDEEIPRDERLANYHRAARR